MNSVVDFLTMRMGESERVRPDQTDDENEF